MTVETEQVGMLLRLLRGGITLICRMDRVAGRTVDVKEVRGKFGLTE